MPSHVLRTGMRWCAAAALLSLPFLATYAAVQQTLRAGADDPQVALAEDAARDGFGGHALVANDLVDVARSVAPWLGWYDRAGTPLRGDGRLDGRLPELPAGVFATARARGEHRVTWQPRAGVRAAIVIAAAPGGFAVAGRSLRETERRIDRIGILVLAAWLATLALAAVLVLTAPHLPRPRRNILES